MPPRRFNNNNNKDNKEATAITNIISGRQRGSVDVQKQKPARDPHHWSRLFNECRQDKAATSTSYVLVWSGTAQTPLLCWRLGGQLSGQTRSSESGR